MPRLSWIIFITWTSTIFGMLWSLYLWLISRQAQLSSRPLPTRTGNLDFGAAAAAAACGGSSSTSPMPSGCIDAFRAKLADGGGGGGGSAGRSNRKLGAVPPPSPWQESIRSLGLFAALLAFLPAWKPLSGAASLPMLLGPAALALVALVVGLTVQMVRLPVLWCDRLKFLALMEREGLRLCGHCGRVE